MRQLRLFDCEIPQKPINVASVPTLSPFRYPGGKTWFIPYVRKWLSVNGGANGRVSVDFGLPAGEVPVTFG